MKLYNPFKPHLVKVNDSKFAYRVLKSFGWYYVGYTQLWFAEENIIRYCFCGTIQEANDRLNQYLLIEKPKSIKFKTKVL